MKRNDLNLSGLMQMGTLSGLHKIQDCNGCFLKVTFESLNGDLCQNVITHSVLKRGLWSKINK